MIIFFFNVQMSFWKCMWMNRSTTMLCNPKLSTLMSNHGGGKEKIKLSRLCHYFLKTKSNAAWRKSCDNMYKHILNNNFFISVQKCGVTFIYGWLLKSYDVYNLLFTIRFIKYSHYQKGEVKYYCSCCGTCFKQYIYKKNNC